MKKLALALIPVLAVALAAASFLWLFCRIPVPPGYMAIVTKKTGKPLPPRQILAAPGEKGVQRDPLPEGRHFRDPVTHSWRIVPLVSIPVGKIGMVTAKVGKEVPSGQILAADSDSKGVWKDVLGPGSQAVQRAAIAGLGVPALRQAHVHNDVFQGRCGIIGKPHSKRRRAPGGDLARVVRQRKRDRRGGAGCASHCRFANTQRLEVERPHVQDELRGAILCGAICDVTGPVLDYGLPGTQRPA